MKRFRQVQFQQAREALRSYGLKALGFLNQQLISLSGPEMGRWMIRRLFAIKIMSISFGLITTLNVRFANDIKLLIKS